MLGFNNNANAESTSDLFNGIGDLGGEVFLYLQAPGVHIDNASNFRQANDFAVGNIGNVTNTDKGQQVVLTQGVELNVFDDNHLAGITGEEGVVDHLIKIEMVALGEKFKGFGGALGCINQAGAG